jgi:uncharacterized protein (DUF2147 family)
MRPILTAVALFFLAAAPALAADPVEGEWLTQAGTAKVRIPPCASNAQRMCGTVVWLKTAGVKDTKNPDPKLRDRPIVGMNLIRDFKPSAPGKWTGGKIYDPESGKTYDSKISANANGTLKVEGCVLVVCQAQTWKRS